MPRQTILLIFALVSITGVLLAIAVNGITGGKIKPTPTPIVARRASPTPDLRKTILKLTPNPVSAPVGITTPINVSIDTGENKITAVQFEIAYDPQALGNVTIQPGSFLPDATALIAPKVDSVKGTISYALVLPPGKLAQTGSGIVASISFTPKKTTLTQTNLSFNSAKTLVAAEGVSQSVLKESLGATIVFSSTTNSSTSSAR